MNPFRRTVRVAEAADAGDGAPRKATWNADGVAPAPAPAPAGTGAAAAGGDGEAAPPSPHGAPAEEEGSRDGEDPEEDAGEESAAAADDDDDDDDDDDSEYTYETDDEEDGARKKKGWFGFLRRGKDAESSDSEAEEEAGGSDAEGAAAEEGADGGVDGQGAPPSPRSTAALASPINPSYPAVAADPAADPAAADPAAAAREDAEALLLAQAIQRVQDRIQSHGGNVYHALSQQDQELVDSLKGVEDGEALREAVARSLAGREAAAADAGGPRGGTGGATAAAPPAAETVREEEPTAAAAAAPSGNSKEEEEEEEEPPTLREQRSLLSLAAEHDRVDVLRELLDAPGDPARRAALLAGTAHDDGGEGGGAAYFAPPPLHVAVAHGAVDAAACLLRLGADPSRRPAVPPALRAPGRAPRGSARGKGTGMEEDRHYGKYHGATAWELAFGSRAAAAAGGAEGHGAGAGREEEPTAGGGRGWFGLGASPREGRAGGRRSRAPLNLPPAKVRGVRHAFAAEALRAVGADEAGRLAQLLAAGMAPTAEAVPGKGLREWAGEMGAGACGALLAEWERAAEGGAGEGGAGAPGAAAPPAEAPGDEAPAPDEAPGDEAPAPDPAPADAPPPDPRLAGLSLPDLRTLVGERAALLPRLEAGRADLRAEVALARAVLRGFGDGAGADGGGTLSSPPFLELVRGLKADRAAAEGAARAWEAAREEREDELDFFWEEVLDAAWRERLGDDLKRAAAGAGAGGDEDPDDGAEGRRGRWSRRLLEGDDRAAALRAALADLAREGADLAAEAERRGVAGALSLARTLRGEAKALEAEVRAAQEDEGAARRQIELIQERLAAAGDGGAGAEAEEERGEAGTLDEAPLPHAARPPAQKEAVVHGVDTNREESAVPGERGGSIANGEGGKGEDVADGSIGETNGLLADDATAGKDTTSREDPSRGGTLPNDGAVGRTPEGASASPSSAGGRPTGGAEAELPNTKRREPRNEEGPSPRAAAQPSKEASAARNGRTSVATVVHDPHGPASGSLSSQIWEIVAPLPPASSSSSSPRQREPDSNVVGGRRNGGTGAELLNATERAPPNEAGPRPPHGSTPAADAVHDADGQASGSLSSQMWEIVAPLPPSSSSSSQRTEGSSAAPDGSTSTALVVHDPHGSVSGSISSQVWDILKMIVGFGKVVPYREEAEGQQRSNIMII